MKQNILILTAIIFCLEFYIYQAFKNIVSNSLAILFYFFINLIVYIILIYNILKFDKVEQDQHRVQLLITLFIAFLLPKIIISLFLLIDDIFRLLQSGVQKLSSDKAIYPERRRFLNLLGLGLGGAFSVLILDGVIFGKYRHRVRKIKLRIRGLPSSFEGYKLIQISDVHSGSFFNPEKLRGAFDLINKQNPDLILFTGDMVNNTADEFERMMHLFKSLKAKDGKFSVLGNHDYGEYVSWNTPKDKENNLKKLISLQEETGFKMLRNQNAKIIKNTEEIYILGVENWGLKPFPQYGDLDKALMNVPEFSVKILMSHDPTHFDEIVKKHSIKVHLTLSGHTHGMQFGLDLKNIKWSPVQYKYKKWVDLYESNNGKYLYVNRGFGVLGYPGRVGINPEITLFELYPA